MWAGHTTRGHPPTYDMIPDTKLERPADEHTTNPHRNTGDLPFSEAPPICYDTSVTEMTLGDSFADLTQMGDDLLPQSPDRQRPLPLIEDESDVIHRTLDAFQPTPTDSAPTTEPRRKRSP